MVNERGSNVLFNTEVEAEQTPTREQPGPRQEVVTEIDGYQTEYRINDGEWTSHSSFTTATTANFSSAAAPNSQFTFRVRTACSRNQSNYSNWVESETRLFIGHTATSTATLVPGPQVTGLNVDCAIQDTLTTISATWGTTIPPPNASLEYIYSVGSPINMSGVQTNRSLSFQHPGDQGFTVDVSVQARTYYDTNGNGVYDSGEPNEVGTTATGSCERAPPTNTITPTPTLPQVQNLRFDCGNNGNDAVVTWTTDHFTTPAVAGFSGDWVVASGDFSQLYSEPWPTPVETSPGHWQTSNNFATQFGLDPGDEFIIVFVAVSINFQDGRQSSEVDYTVQVICTVQTEAATPTHTSTATATHTSTSTATLVPATCPKPTGLSFDLLSGSSVIISWGPVDFQPSGFPTAFVEFAAATVMAGDEATVTLRTTGADSYRLESSTDGGDYTTILDGDGDINTDRVCLRRRSSWNGHLPTHGDQYGRQCVRQRQY